MLELPGGTPFYPNACQHCQQDSPDLKRCSACKTFAYCSREHQRMDWGVHKALCGALRRANERIPYRVRDYEDFLNYKTVRMFAVKSELGRDLEAYEMSVCRNLMACEVCFKKEDLFECTGCKSVWFCSEEHEEENSVVHKRNCADLRICRLSDLYRDEINWRELTVKNHTSRIKTISLALDFIKFNHETLDLHIIGASFEEEKSVWDFSLIKEHIFNVKRIKLHFIGPEAVPIHIPDTPGIKITSTSYKKFYHDVVNELPKPSMVVLFNAGLHENRNRDSEDDLWKPSIKYFFRGAPILLTGYCKEELEMDKNVLFKENRECRVVLDCTKNPFFAAKPFRDCMRYTSVFYSNRFICICEGLLEEFK